MRQRLQGEQFPRNSGQLTINCVDHFCRLRSAFYRLSGRPPGSLTRWPDMRDRKRNVSGTGVEEGGRLREGWPEREQATCVSDSSSRRSVVLSASDADMTFGAQGNWPVAVWCSNASTMAWPRARLPVTNGRTSALNGYRLSRVYVVQAPLACARSEATCAPTAIGSPSLAAWVTSTGRRSRISIASPAARTPRSLPTWTRRPYTARSTASSRWA